MANIKGKIWIFVKPLLIFEEGGREMDLEQLLSGGMNMPAPGQDVPTMDTSETIQISSLALLKMLKHGMNDAFLARRVLPLCI